MSRAERSSRSGSGSEWSSAFRRDDDADAHAEDGVLRAGCSMLSRIRMQPRTPGALCVMRCSLGYALTADDDVAKCRAVDGPSTCWKGSAPSWRVSVLPPEPLEPVHPLANGHVSPEAGEMNALVELGEADQLEADEVIEMELTSIEVVGDDA